MTTNAFKVTKILLITSLVSLLYSAAANAETYSDCATVESSGGNAPGERLSCGQCYGNGILKSDGCVKCATVQLFVPSDERIISKSRKIDSELFYSWLDDISVKASPSGKNVSTTVKSWNEAGNRICLSVVTEEKSNR